ncbi:MAG TPA: hypothetical protein VFX21_06720, partial [Acidimicrobiia bacterium]|nr:hypothetical protein [Acidimicrobiia bacterium]
MPSARRSFAVIAIVAIALTMLVTGTADAGIVIPRDDATVIDGPTVAQEGPSVVIEWSMPKRFGLPQTNAYVRNSAGWKVTVTTCGSYTNASGVTITGSSWILYDKGVQLASSTTCKKTITLPHLGFYDVKGTIRTSNGGTYTAQRRIELKDHLIVVAGDSMASGEGNPDVKGDADISWCGSSKLEEQLMPWSCVVQMIDLITNNPSVLV